jgi:flagellin
MVINTNMAAESASARLGDSSRLLSKSLARLASGSKIVSPEDDAAGLAVSLQLKSQIHRSAATVTNIANTVSFCQVQDGLLSKMGKALDRMSELAVLAQDTTKTDGDRSMYNEEFQTLASYIREASTKGFNGVSLFGSAGLNITTDSEGGVFTMQGIEANYFSESPPPTSGTPSPPLASTQLQTLIPTLSGFQSFATSYLGSVWPNNTIGDLVSELNTLPGVGAAYDSSSGEMTVTVPPGEVLRDWPHSGLLDDLGIGTVDNSDGSTPLARSVILRMPELSIPASSLDISTLSAASAALTSVKSALTQLSSDRATVGASITRLNYASEQQSMVMENLSAANSRIEDVDVAEESTVFVRASLLVQAGTAMLSQANSAPSMVLRLLG